MKHATLMWAALWAFSGCYQYVDGGPEASETRTVEAFDSVRVDDGLQVTVVSGAPQVTLDAPEKALKYIATSVKNGRLVVELRSGVTVTSLDTIAVTVSGEGVSSLETTGGSRLTAEHLEASVVRVTASGGSLITLAGATPDLRITASGGSTVAAGKLVSEEASVEASGLSKVEVQATKRVLGSASGGSTVTVTGGADGSSISTSGGSAVN